MLADRGFRFSRTRSIVPPLPAASRPSNRTTSRFPLSITSCIMRTSCICNAAICGSYSALGISAL